MTMPPPVLQIEEAPTRKPTSGFRPTLKWPSLDTSSLRVDLARFPSRDEENLRYGAGEFGSWSEDFLYAIRSARSRVWLIDGFLLKTDEYAAGSFIIMFDLVLKQTSANDIRMLTSSKNGHQEQIGFLRKLQDTRRALRPNEGFSIEVRLIRDRKSGLRLPHDRFALIDDELWHCGANVGGTHHEINAYSRGWPAHETGAADYFQRLWNQGVAP